MWLDNDIVRKDLEYAVSVPFIDWPSFAGKHFFITGGTGLIGSAIVNVLAYANRAYNLGLSLMLLVRDGKRARTIFSEQMKYCSLDFIEGNIESLPPIAPDFDYIIHGASQTASKAFAEQPVETINTAVLGTLGIFEFARKNPLEGFIYLSSMEVYGTPQDDRKIMEDNPAVLSLSSARSSYPASKCLAESIAVSYFAEYKVPAKVIRLTQTFGPGVRYSDQRVFAEFARCAIEGRNIVLATKGETCRSYLYTIDAATAILSILQRGKSGEAYNAANEATYCSVKAMAELVAGLGDDRINVVVDESKAAGRGFAPVLHMNLDTSKLKALGWYPSYDLETMFRNLMATMSDS